MTNKEAAKTIITSMFFCDNGNLIVEENNADKFLDAICFSLSALLKQGGPAKPECKSKEKDSVLWHDAKKEPPKTNGYYFAKTSTDECFHRVCIYIDGEWFIDLPKMNPINIVAWAGWDDFLRIEDDA